jgi:hypothetical protein
MPGMRLRRDGTGLAVAALLALLAGGAPANAGDDPAPPPVPAPSSAPPPVAKPKPEVPSPEDKKRLESLRDRAKKWCEIRTRIVTKCPTCGGDGKVTKEGSRAGRLVLLTVPCNACVRGGRVDTRKAREAWFDFYTPAWRAEQANVESAQQWIDTLPKEPAKGLLRKYSIASAELAGPVHGIVRVQETRETEQIQPTTYRWVWAEDPKTKTPTWWLWHESDGPFAEPPPAPPDVETPPTDAPAAKTPETPPAAAGMADPAPAPARSAPAALAAEAFTALAKRFAVVGVAPELVEASLAGDTLVLRLRATGVRTEEQLEAAIAEAIVPATRAAMAEQEKAATVRLVFLARYRDKVGEVAEHPFETVEMTRQLFEKIRFDRLTAIEALDLFTRDRHVYRLEGLILWWKD